MGGMSVAGWGWAKRTGYNSRKHKKFLGLLVFPLLSPVISMVIFECLLFIRHPFQLIPHDCEVIILVLYAETSLGHFLLLSRAVIGVSLNLGFLTVK